MGRTLDFILTFAALVVGIMLVTGYGGIFMKGGNSELRRKLYDEKKMEKASGIALIIIGIATGIDSYTTGVVAKVAYIVVLIAVLAILIYYLRTKCKK